MEEINKILVPVDFSEISERLIDLALFVAEQYEAELTVIYVAEGVYAAMPGFAMADLPIVQLEEDIIDNSEKRLDTILKKHGSGSSVPLQKKVLRGHIAEEIIEYSKAHDFDLIIMGTHGYRGLEKMFMGSVTDRVLKLAPCPVLTTR